MAKADYYEVLGVGRQASAGEMKSAYRKLAMQYHPDRNPGDDEAERKFKELNEAYEVLKDDAKRQRYDRFGHAAFENGGGGGAGGFGFGQGMAGGFADIFEEMFGEVMGGRRRNARPRGADLRFNMTVTLEESFAGVQRTIEVPTAAPCEVCDGSGAEPGTSPVTCPTCGGAGKVRAQSGFFTIERGCPNCGGAGKVVKTPCRACHGRGQVHRTKTLSVSVPAGIEEGTRIRLAEEGEIAPRGGDAGDLYIFVSVAPHRFFQREGSDLHCRVPIPMTVAALGGTVEVPTIDGSPAKLTIPEGAQTGDRFRLAGRGMSVLRSSSRGDLYLHTVVETPKNLTKRQRELLKEFAEAGEAEETHPESQGFFAKVRELWSDLTE